MMLNMPVHAPVEKFHQWIDLDGAYTFAEVRHIFLQTAVLCDAHCVGAPIGNEGRTGDEDGQDPLTCGNANDEDGAVKKQQYA